MNSGGERYIRILQKRWIISGVLACVFTAASISLVFTSVWEEFSSVSFWSLLPLTIMISLALIWAYGILKISRSDVSRLLNQSFPQLEESTELFLKPEADRNILEKLQVQKLEHELTGLSTPPHIYRRLKISGIILCIGVLFAVLLAKTGILKFGFETPAGQTKQGAAVPLPDNILPGITSVSLIIKPPAYTGHTSRQQSQFSATAEDGSVLSWLIQTSQPVKSLQFIFNDKEAVELRPLNKEGRSWAFSKTINTPGFYQVKLDDKLSELYKLETIKDMAALIRIISPPQYSTIDFGQPKKTFLQVQISDDYGINNAYISATISSGQGEGVKFKEQKIRFSEPIRGGQQYKLQKVLELPSLGMQPGDELYFYIHATDSRQQQSRSDIYIVTIQDTAQLMSMDGMLGGINLVPEYFRSQRQIIIDTEKLLKEKNTISAEDFNNRSNNLGIDQKLLRLRYGKFLGEETDEDIGADHEGEESADAEQPAVFGNAEKLMDAYAHKHDIAEDATFFEPELKAQLKATLAEMWKSELRLRIYKPSEALPFEYKALRLLKDLQQKSRVYVAKTAFKPPQIKADKRLSGDLDKIVQPSAERNLPKTEEQNSLRRSTAIIARLKEGGKLSQPDLILLQDANLKLAAQAAAKPAVYLKALGSMRSITNSQGSGKISSSELSELESALQRLIREESRTPKSEKTAPSTALSREYFNNLKRQEQ